MIILDTNVVSERQRPVPDEIVMTWLENQNREKLFLTAITVAELRYGIAILDKGRRRDFLDYNLEEEILPSFLGRVLSFDEVASRFYADLVPQARGIGIAISLEDGYIAAIAAAHNMQVATRDSRPFEAAGLVVIDPWLAPPSHQVH